MPVGKYCGSVFLFGLLVNRPSHFLFLFNVSQQTPFLGQQGEKSYEREVSLCGHTRKAETNVSI